MDAGTVYTDRKTQKVEKQITKVYEEARKDIREKIEVFNKKYEKKYAIHMQELKDGKITQDQFDAWVKGQVFQGKQWMAKEQQITNTIHHANEVAAGIVNGNTQSVFATNATYMSYYLEHSQGINFGFGIYDGNTVSRLITEDPKLLPEWKINEPKDYIWNQKKLNNALTQGIIQGESLNKIANRIANNLAMQNKNASLTFARTAMTGAQNAGRNQSLSDAKKKGINVVKQWMTTFDNRTRDSHRDIDGEKISTGDRWHPMKFSNGCRYPGDPEGPPHEVYNCRCTLVGDVEDYPSEYARYDNIDGKPIKNMTYREWEKAKKSGPIEPWTAPQTFVAVIDDFQSKLGKVQTVKEVNDLMNSQGWFRDLGAAGPDWADLSGCELESAKSIAAAYEQVFTKYPQLKGKLDAPNASPRNMKDGTYAWCYMKRNGKVQVNPKWYSDWNKLVQGYERDVISGWHPRGTTAEAIVTHEIGHAIDGLLAREGILGGVTSTGEYRFASSSLKNTIMKRAAKLDPNIAEEMELDKWLKDNATVLHNVSEYATKNNKEWFAECFAEYITSANPRTVAAEFGKELEKLLARLK